MTSAGSGDRLAERIAKVGDRVSHVVALASPSPDLMRANEGAYAALASLLAAHAPTALVRYTEACPRHYASLFGRRECPDCVKIERNGCETCRDENGMSVCPEDCEVRKVITRNLTATISAGQIDAAVNRG